MLTHVRVGDVWINANEIAGYLARYSENLFCLNYDPIWEVSRRGTCSLLRYKNGFYAVSTFHQIRDLQADHLAIQSGREQRYVTGGALYWDERVHGPERDDAFDLAVIDYTQTTERGLIDDRMFWPHFGLEFLRNNEAINFLFVIGFADSDQSNDMIEDSDGNFRLEHMTLSKRMISCSYGGNSFQSEVFLAEMHRQVDIDPNGFSGSPVFAICGSEGEYCVKFAGIVLRAGGGRFHCLKHTRIRSLLDHKI